MPAALPITIRKEIVERRIRGEAFTHISREMGLSYDSVRAIWRHWEREGKLAPNYDNCRQTGPRKPREIYERAIEMKRDYPFRGAGVIRILLQDEFGVDADVPGVRTLQTWFKAARVNRPRVKRDRRAIQRGENPHDVWAIDAKEKMELQDGSQASWLVVTDEGSGAILHTEAFPPRDLESD